MHDRTPSVANYFEYVILNVLEENTQSSIVRYKMSRFLLDTDEIFSISFFKARWVLLVYSYARASESLIYFDIHWYI